MKKSSCSKSFAATTVQQQFLAKAGKKAAKEPQTSPALLQKLQTAERQITIRFTSWTFHSQTKSAQLQKRFTAPLTLNLILLHSKNSRLLKMPATANFRFVSQKLRTQSATIQNSLALQADTPSQFATFNCMQEQAL